MTKFAYGVWFAAILVVAAGCSPAESSVGPSDVTTSAGTSTTSATMTRSGSPSSSVGPAPSGPVSPSATDGVVRLDVADATPAEWTRFVDVAPAESVPPGDFLGISATGSRAFLSDSRVTWWAPDGSVRSLPSHGLKRGFLYAVTDEEVVVLRSESDQLDTFDWTLRILDRGGLRTLASSEQLYPGKPVPALLSRHGIVVTKDTVYWSATTPLVNGLTSVKLWSVPKKGGKTHLVSEGAVSPRLDGDGVVFAEWEGLQGVKFAGELSIRRVQGERSEVLTRHTPRSELGPTWSICSSPGVLSWVTDRRLTQEIGMEKDWGELSIADRQGKIATVIRVDDAEYSTTIGCTNRYVAWGNGAGNYDGHRYLLDLKTQELWQLSDALGGSMVYMGGTSVTWTEVENGRRRYFHGTWRDSPGNH